MNVLKTLPAVTVATAGTRVQISASQRFARAIRIEADASNTGSIYVGDANVSSSRYAARLNAGDALALAEGLFDLSDLYVDASANAQKVQVSYV